MIKIFKSESESKVYGLELYRGKAESTAELSNLMDQLIENNVDVCRLKVNANEREVFSFLGSLGVPYQLYNMLYTNYVSISDLPESAFAWPEEYSFDCFRPTDLNRMRSMVKRTITEKTWVNYTSDLVCDRITDEREVLASQEYACSFYTEDGSRASWIIKFNGDDIGYFMGEESGKGFNGTFYGIVPEHRNKQHSKVVYMMMLSICRQRGNAFFSNDIGVLNIPSQKSAAGQQMVATDIYFHLELYPFLSAGKKDEMCFRFESVKDIMIRAKQNWAIEMLGKSAASSHYTHRFNWGEISGVSIGLSVCNERSALLVARFYDENDTLLTLQYTQFK